MSSNAQAAYTQNLRTFLWSRLSFITPAMQVKLLDLTAQYLTLRRDIRKAIDDV